MNNEVRIGDIVYRVTRDVYLKDINLKQEYGSAICLLEVSKPEASLGAAPKIRLEFNFTFTIFGEEKKGKDYIVDICSDNLYMPGGIIVADVRDASETLDIPYQELHETIYEVIDELEDSFLDSIDLKLFKTYNGKRYN